MTAPVVPRRTHPWWVGTISGMASYIDAAAIISFGSALVIYQHAIGIDGNQVGLASGALTLGIAIGALVGGGLGDRFGRRPVFSLTMVLIAAGALALAVSTSFPALLAGAIVLGLGVGADLPVSLATIAEAATDANRGKLIGFSQILWFAGILAAIGLGIAFGNAGRLGGQLMFGHLVVMSLVVLAGRLSIPESDAWRAARAERADGAGSPAPVGVLLRAPHLVPLAALVVFYSLTNLAANTMGQFGTYLLVNVAGLDVRGASALALVMLPVPILGTLGFMAIADGPRRFGCFTAGAVLLVVGSLVPVFAGFTVGSFVVSRVVTLVGASFAGEAMMKLWVQESFPVLLRTTAQGAVIAIARLLAAVLAGFTPLLIAAGVGLLFGVLAALCAAGVLTAWVVFRPASGRTG